MLLFKKKFLPAIRSGEKTQSIRLWKVCRYRTGQRSYIPGAGYIRITSVEPIALDDLTDLDAVRDGFVNRSALLDEVARIYADEPADSAQAYRVTFCLLPTDEWPNPHDKQIRRRKARTTAKRTG